MNISEQKSGDLLRLAVAGRLDAEGAKKLEHDLDDCLRRGERHLRLGLEMVNYISSAGIKVLMAFRKKLMSIDGSFAVSVKEGGQVYGVLEMAGLTALLEAASSPTSESKREEAILKEGVKYDIMERRGGSFTAKSLGSTDKLKHGSFTERDAATLRFPANSLTLGIGALGSGFERCRESFGEFLAVGGIAASRPPGTTAIDYMIPREKVVPEGTLISGLRFNGEFDVVFRFHPENDGDSIPLTTLGRSALDFLTCDHAVVVAAVEVAEIVGVALIKSPALKSEDENIFDFPGIRDWLSFTGEPVYKRTTGLVVGMASTSPNPASSVDLKEIGAGLFGQFQSLLFSYHPLSRSQTNLTDMTANLFENHQILDLLRLVNDDRQLLGVGQSAFIRGTAWAGAVKGGFS